LEADRYDGIFQLTNTLVDQGDESEVEEEDEPPDENSVASRPDDSEPPTELEKELGFPFVTGLGDVCVQTDVDRQLKMREEQRKDPVLKALGDFLENRVKIDNDEIRHWVKIWAPRCDSMEGVLYYCSTDEWELTRRVVPHQLRQSLLKEYHTLNTGGHFSARRTFEELRKRYWWPQMKEDAQIFVDNCYNCTAKSGQGHFQAPPMKNLPVPAVPNEILCMDLLKMPVTPRGNQYIMVLTDLLTRQAFAYPIPDKEAATVAWYLYDRYFGVHGPRKIQ